MNHNVLLEDQNMSFIDWMTHHSIEKVKNLINQPSELHYAKQLIGRIFHFINIICSPLK